MRLVDRIRQHLRKGWSDEARDASYEARGATKARPNVVAAREFHKDFSDSARAAAAEARAKSKEDPKETMRRATNSQGEHERAARFHELRAQEHLKEGGDNTAESARHRMAAEAHGDAAQAHRDAAEAHRHVAISTPGGGAPTFSSDDRKVLASRAVGADRVSGRAYRASAEAAEAGARSR